MTHVLLVIIYLAFISLGLPDAVFGGSWPTMYVEFGVPVSYAGIVSTVITVGTIFSSLFSDRLTLRLGTGKVTAISVAMTAGGLIGFSMSGSFVELLIWSIPYGLGAGGVDASINNYVAIHYSSRVMSWLHCMWGLGAATGPYVLGWVLMHGGNWNAGYSTIGIMQIVLTAILLLSLPLWKERKVIKDDDGQPQKALSIKEILAIPGAKEIIMTFFCYCAVEQTAGLWASSYLVLFKGVSEAMAATYASMFYIGITVGRFICGFLTMRFNDKQMIRIGSCILCIGILVLFLPLSEYVSLAGFIMIGVGCAPVYPCIIHSTPIIFGEEKSQAIIGIEMASAYVGTLAAPPIYGVLASYITPALLPIYLLAITIVMIILYEYVVKKHN